MNGPDFKRVPFVACYSHSGVGAANRNQRGSVIRMLCFNVRPYLWKHGKRGGSDMEAKLRQMHAFWGKDHTCSKHDEPKNRKNKPTRGSDLWYSFQPSHLATRRSVSRLFLPDNKDRCIRATKSSTTWSGQPHRCGISLQFDFVGYRFLLYVVFI